MPLLYGTTIKATLSTGVLPGGYFPFGAENVPGTPHKFTGHAVFCCGVPGTHWVFQA